MFSCGVGYDCTLLELSWFLILVDVHFHPSVFSWNVYMV